MSSRTGSPDIVKLSGVEPTQTIWINRVPEFKAVKNRIRLDVHVAMTELPGATPVSAPGEFGWRVMADPDGGEFCAFVRREVGPYRMYELVVDALDAKTLASWWAQVLGGATEVSEEGWHAIEGASGVPFESIVFAPVPEGKTGKNRVHWDVEVDFVGAVAELESLGARVLRRPDSDVEWTVMADPEGNEFCVFVTV
ncbi:Glyoxalase [Rhodococcus sp. AW25M09]|uniref:VOC family protein n=1 Tax=Rhodococcus sp. AW25M09 TaxID=1268303 RepID=UPI0002ACD87F|nr:VOC family protein [Rhodococcus sp. AW25M09]CCQ16059.1 Glyoxalase [Rhodococcus sp. AW25M09]